MTRKRGVVDQERYEVLKGMLEERRQEIQQKLRSLRESLPVEAGEVRDAEEAGLQKGDVIVSVNGKAVSGVEEFERAVEGARPDGAARLRVLSSAGSGNGYRIVVLRLQK